MTSHIHRKRSDGLRDGVIVDGYSNRVNGKIISKGGVNMAEILLLIGICMALVSVFIIVSGIVLEMYTHLDMDKICNFGITIALFSIPFVAAYMVVVVFQKIL